MALKYSYRAGIWLSNNITRHITQAEDFDLSLVVRDAVKKKYYLDSEIVSSDIPTIGLVSEH